MADQPTPHPDIAKVAETKKIRAAEYVRMSTDHQKYSTENQADRIRQYADKHGMEIVKTYADEGKSGLRIEGRDALKQLIDDVEAGTADFEIIDEAEGMPSSGAYQNRKIRPFLGNDIPVLHV